MPDGGGRASRIWLWVRVAAVAAALAIPYAVHQRAHAPKEPAAFACAGDSQCEVRGKDEWERCSHVDAPVDRNSPRAARDATSKTQEGYSCRCVTKACSWTK